MLHNMKHPAKFIVSPNDWHRKQAWDLNMKRGQVSTMEFSQATMRARLLCASFWVLLFHNKASTIRFQHIVTRDFLSVGSILSSTLSFSISSFSSFILPSTFNAKYQHTQHNTDIISFQQGIKTPQCKTQKCYMMPVRTEGQKALN